MAGPQSSVREFVIWGVFIRVEDRSVEHGPVVPAPDTPESPRSALFHLATRKRRPGLLGFSFHLNQTQAHSNLPCTKALLSKQNWGFEAHRG